MVVLCPWCRLKAHILKTYVAVDGKMTVLLFLAYSYGTPKENFIPARTIELKVSYNLQIMHEVHNEQVKALPSV